MAVGVWAGSALGGQSPGRLSYSLCTLTSPNYPGSVFCSQDHLTIYLFEARRKEGSSGNEKVETGVPGSEAEGSHCRAGLRVAESRAGALGIKGSGWMYFLDL